MIHLLVGPDHYLVERRIREILAVADPDHMNSVRLDRTAALTEVESAVATPGFFGTGRVVVADGVMQRASGTGKARKAEADDIGRIMDALAPGNSLLLVDTALHSVPKAIRDLAPDGAKAFVGTPPRGSDLVSFVNTCVAEIGARIERRAVQHVLDHLFPGDWQAPNRNPAYDNPPDLQTLVSELQKLATAAGGEEISHGLVSEMTVRQTQDQLFPVVDALIAGNVRAVMTLLGANQDDETIAQITGQLAANAELAPIAMGLRESELKAIGDRLGVKPTRLGAIQRSFTPATAGATASLMLETDRHMKTGVTRGPEALLFEFLLRRSRAPRETSR